MGGEHLAPGPRVPLLSWSGLVATVGSRALNAWHEPSVRHWAAARPGNCCPHLGAPWGLEPGDPFKKSVFTTGSFLQVGKLRIEKSFMCMKSESDLNLAELSNQYRSSCAIDETNVVSDC